MTEKEDGALLFGGSGFVEYRDGRADSSNATLDAHAARAKYLPTGGNARHGGGGLAGGADDASRTSKGKVQWGWGAGKSLFGKKTAVEVKRSEPSEQEAHQTDIRANSFSIAAAAASAARAASAAAASTAGTSGSAVLSFGDRNKGGRGGSSGGGGAGSAVGGDGSVVSSRSRDGPDLARKTSADAKRQGGGRRLASETSGTHREPGGERGRVSRSAVEQRSSLNRDGSGREMIDIRVRDRRSRQSRSVDSPNGKITKGATTTTADAAVKAAHGFFSVPAATYGESREGGSGSVADSGGGRQQRRGKERSVSIENEVTALRRDRMREHVDRGTDAHSTGDERRTAGAGHRSGSNSGNGGSTGGDDAGEQIREQRAEEETRLEAKKRRSPVQAGTRRERESSQRPSRCGRTRTRSEERFSSSDNPRGEGKQWRDLANPRPPLPLRNQSPAREVVTPSGLLSKCQGGGSGRISAASPVHSSNGTSDDKSRATSRMDDSSKSSTGWGTNSLAGWGETTAADAEAEVLGRSRCGDASGSGRVGGGGAKERGEDGVDPTLRGQPERTRLHQMVAALTDLCLYLVGVSPLSMEECPSMLELLPSDDDDWDEVCLFRSIFSHHTVWCCCFGRRRLCYAG